MNMIYVSFNEIFFCMVYYTKHVIIKKRLIFNQYDYYLINLNDI